MDTGAILNTRTYTYTYILHHHVLTENVLDKVQSARYVHILGRAATPLPPPSELIDEVSEALRPVDVAARTGNSR